MRSAMARTGSRNGTLTIARCSMRSGSRRTSASPDLSISAGRLARPRIGRGRRSTRSPRAFPLKRDPAIAAIMGEFHGRFVWYELMTTDMAAATAFYATVLGWHAREAAMPGMAYTLFTAGEAAVGAVMTLPEEARKIGVPPRWTGYVGVDDVDAATDRVKSLGGAVHVAPADIPNIGRFSIVADPQMATLA